MSFQRTALAAAICGAFLSLPSLAHAQAYPVKPVRVIVPNPPGGATDVLARIVAEELTPRLGRQVVVEHRPGASGTIGSNVVAKAPPDGYSMVMGHAASHATSPSMYRNLPYDPVSDFAPVTLVANVTNVIVIHPSLPPKSAKELEALAKARPGELVFGSGGSGAITHLAGELFKQKAGVNLVHVPYKGSGQAMADIVGGQVPIAFDQVVSSMPQVEAGKLRALAVTSAKRFASVPNLPTMSEAGVPGYEAVSWNGLAAPAATPREIVSRIQQDVARVLQLPDIKERFFRDGIAPVGSTPEQFAAHVRSERAKWEKVADAAGLKPQ